MKRFIVAVLLLTATQSVFAQVPLIRAHLEPSTNITVGQPVRLVVTVLAPNYFTGAPDFPPFEIEDAIVVLPQDRPDHSNTQIGGVTYAGITQTYVIYPQQGGDFQVPPVKVSVPYAMAPPKSATALVALPTLNFHAEVPAAARDLPYFLPTTSLSITQRWSPPLKGLRVGDTVKRTITITATKLQAMLIPPVDVVQPDGIRVYNNEPTVRDKKTDRGDFVYGQRIQSVKYFIEKPGNYTLPPIELKWWNVTTHRLVDATLPAVAFGAINNPDYVAELPPSPPEPAAPTVRETSTWRRYRSKIQVVGEFVFSLILFLAAAIKYLPKIATALAGIWSRWKSSELYLFRALLRVACANDARTTYVSLTRWIKSALPESSLDKVMQDFADEDTALEFSRLVSELFQATPRQLSAWNGKKFARGMKELRRRWKSSMHGPSIQSRLPDLNPK